MASPASVPDSSKFRRAPDASAMSAADARERLLKVDELQKLGKVDEAVHELLIVAAQYATRGAPVKAVAVLRQAVRLKPDSADVRMSYGEVLQQLRMQEDAAREYAIACQQLEAAGRYGEWLEVLQRLLAMDQDNLHGRLQLAEALSRAGKNTEAAAAFRALAEVLMQRDEIDDWEKIAERLLFHDPSDNTTAHDLALHYVRSGRHAEALGKLILCYEAVPQDAELLELIIDTLEALGQPEKAALICRELVRTYRRTGLQEEAERALTRLYSLDPDDAEAREFMGVLAPSVAQGTVIELEAGNGMSRRRSTSAMLAARPMDAAGVEGDSAVPMVQPRRPSMRIPIEGLAQTVAARPTMPELARATPAPAPLRATTPQRIQVAAPAPRSSSTVPAHRPSSASPAPRPVPSVSAQRPMSVGPSSSSRTPAVTASRAPTYEPATASSAVDWGDAPTSRPATRATHVQALEALFDASDEELQIDPPGYDDDEAGFDQPEDRTMVQDIDLSLLGYGGRALSVPELSAHLQAPPVPSDEPVASTRRRSNSLPRPRLSRRPSTMTELPSALREISKDLSTLDFFIEGGYLEAAVALLDALQKRHPEHADLSHYRARIERMTRG